MQHEHLIGHSQNLVRRLSTYGRTTVRAVRQHLKNIQTGVRDEGIAAKSQGHAAAIALPELHKYDSLPAEEENVVQLLGGI